MATFREPELDFRRAWMSSLRSSTAALMAPNRVAFAFSWNFSWRALMVSCWALTVWSSLSMSAFWASICSCLALISSILAFSAADAFSVAAFSMLSCIALISSGVMVLVVVLEG